MADPGTPVIEIEGVGPATEQLLRAADVHTVFDLLRVSAADLHRVVASVASPAECEGWRRMAFLMQVEAVDGQLAEALWGGGVETLEDLSRRSLSELRALCEAAQAAGRLPALPDDETLAGVLRDAARLQHTGALTGTLLSAAGAPVAGAEVRLGLAHATSDARGRFRLFGVPHGVPPVLSIRADGFRAVDLDDPGLEPDPQTVVVRLWRLQPVDPAQAAAGELSAHAGDVLPRMAGQPMTTQRLQRAQVREGDLLMLRRDYDGGSDVELVSKLPSFREGRFVFFTWRVARSELPAGAQRGAGFRVRGGAFSPGALTPRAIRATLANRRWRRAQGLDAADPAALDVDAVIDTLVDVLDAEGMLHS